MQASLLAYLTPGSVVSPFLLAGAGWYLTHASAPGYGVDSSRLGVHAGVGLEIWINRWWSVDGTWRYARIGDAPTGVAGKTYEADGWQSTAGVNFHF